MKRLLTVGLIALVAALGYMAYDRWGRQEPLPQGLIQANGRIEGDHVSVAGKISGRIEKILANEGDSVAAGQRLVQLDDIQVEAKVDQARAKVTQAHQAVAALGAQIRAALAALMVLQKEVPLVIQTAEAGVDHARALVGKAQAAEEQARRDADRFRRLAAKGTVDQHRAEQASLSWTVAQDDLASARTGLVQAQRQLDQARLGWDRIGAKKEEIAALQAQQDQARAAQSEAQAGLAEASSILADLAITAPSSGVITTRLADAGEVVAAGAPLFDLVNLDRLYLKVYVPEVQIGRLRLGLPARIYTDAFPEEPFPAVVRYISSRAEFTPKEVQTPDERVKLVYAVKLYLEENPDHRLTPGLPADAIIRWKEDAPWAKPQW